MIDITSYVIDDLNNGLDPDEHLKDGVTIYNEHGIFYIYINNEMYLITDSITTLLQYVVLHLIVKGEK